MDIPKDHHMPRVRDFFVAVKKVGFFHFFKTVWKEISEDHLLDLAAALAYSWLFAIFPFVIFLISLTPYLPIDKAQFLQFADETVQTFLPDRASAELLRNIEAVVSRPKEALTITGLVLALWASAGGMARTMHALNRCYDVDDRRPFWKLRPLAAGITVAVATMILLVIVLLPVGTIVTRWFLNQPWVAEYDRWLTGPTLMLWNVIRWTLSALLMSAVVSTVYYFGPMVRQPFRLLSPGGLFTVAVWVVLGLAFRFYVNSFGGTGYELTYGTVGGVAILLLVFYLDALVLLIGAEINSETDYIILNVPRGSTNLYAGSTNLSSKSPNPDQNVLPK